MKNGIKANGIRQSLLKKQKLESDQELMGVTGRIEYYEAESTRIRKRMDEAAQRKQQLDKQMKSFSHILHPRKASELKKEIEETEQEQKNLGEYLERVQTNSGFQTETSLQEAKDYAEELNANLRELSESIDALKAEEKNLVAEYKESYSILPEELKREVPGPEDEANRKKTDTEDKQKHRGR